MRAGWILLEIRHKQYEVNVDEVGACLLYTSGQPERIEELFAVIFR